MWVAGKEQIVLRDGRYVTVKPGEPLPEAAGWSRSWLRCGFVDWVDDEPDQSAQPKVLYQAQKLPTPDMQKLYGTRELRKKSKEELVALAAPYGIHARPLKRDDIIRRIREAQGAVS